MPAPGTRGRIPEIRKIVTGHCLRTANHRDIRITSTVAAKVATADVVAGSVRRDVYKRQYIHSMHQAGKILWGNALEYNHKIPLAAGHCDNISLLDHPDKGWGWLADKGFDIIQTDWAAQCCSCLLYTSLKLQQLCI